MNRSERTFTDLSFPVNPTPREIRHFFEYVDKESCPSGCWIWWANRNILGYGRAAFRGGVIKAHRLAWALFNGPIPKETPYVLHNCPCGDIPSCVNPNHLWLGTHAQNMSDAGHKGQMQLRSWHARRRNPEVIPRGETHWHCKLTAEKVKMIKIRLSSGESANRIAMDYGVAGTTIRSIKGGYSWGHVE